MHPYLLKLLHAANFAPAWGDVPAGPGSALLTPDETAGRLRLARQTLARWRCEGRGPPFIRLGGVGGRVAYRVVDVDAWLASRRAFSTAEADRSAGCLPGKAARARRLPGGRTPGDAEAEDSP